MDGQNSSRVDKKEQEIHDRVTLKKEIGLMSACTIIIGKCAKLVKIIIMDYVNYIWLMTI